MNPTRDNNASDWLIGVLLRGRAKRRLLAIYPHVIQNPVVNGSRGQVKLTGNALITDVQPNQRFSGHSNGHSVRHPQSAEGHTAIAGSLHPC